jgi:hypothetical protein
LDGFVDVDDDVLEVPVEPLPDELALLRLAPVDVLAVPELVGDVVDVIVDFFFFFFFFLLGVVLVGLVRLRPVVVVRAGVAAVAAV